MDPTLLASSSSSPARPPPPPASSSSQRRPASPAASSSAAAPPPPAPASKAKGRSRRPDDDAAHKRRCVSTACIACRKRKSRCDGNTPSCAACATVYGTACVYDPNSDHRRKGVYKKDADSLKTRSSTLQTLISAILNYPADEVPELVRQIRSCESLDKVADLVVAREAGGAGPDVEDEDSPIQHVDPLSFEHQLSSKVGELRIEDGSLRFIGGTSNLLYSDNKEESEVGEGASLHEQSRDEAILSWTSVTQNPEVVLHLLNMYFTWHYPFFTILSRSLFWRDFYQGRSNVDGKRKTEYCSALLVNAMLALGSHFSSSPAAREDADDSATSGDHYFKETKRLINEGDLYEDARLTTVQALALMSVREAGCGRESRGWVYSGISFRMACDLGLNYESDSLLQSGMSADEIDCRRITFWGCFLFDKCWSNYLGRLPLFQTSNNVTVPKFEVSGHEDAEPWCPYTDSGPTNANAQPSRIRAVALQISSLCDISSDLMKFFYHPQERNPSRQAEVTRLGDCHSRLETWRRNLPKEMEPKEGGLPSVLVMHMLFHLLYIHLFRPFLKYSPSNSPLPAHVSPRKLCTSAATTISKLLRLYKRSYGLRQICNIAVYIAHSACTIHLLNLPEKNARRDIAHGVRHLEEIADGWLCARRTLCVLGLQARRWHIDLPEDAASVLDRAEARYGRLGSPRDVGRTTETQSPVSRTAALQQEHDAAWMQSFGMDMSDADLEQAIMPASMLSPAPTLTDPNSSYQRLLRQQRAWQARNGIATTTSDAGLVPVFAQASMPADAEAAGRVPAWADTRAAQAHAQQATTQAQAQTPPQRTKRRISASDTMFGGVEALLKEGQDWWVADQAQVASGFGNWGTFGGGAAVPKSQPPQPHGSLAGGTVGVDASHHWESGQQGTRGIGHGAWNAEQGVWFE